MSDFKPMIILKPIARCMCTEPLIWNERHGSGPWPFTAIFSMHMQRKQDIVSYSNCGFMFLIISGSQYVAIEFVTEL